MCCITVLFYKLLQKCHKKKEEAASAEPIAPSVRSDKQHELVTLEEHIDEKMIELITDMYKWRNSLRKFPPRNIHSCDLIRLYLSIYRYYRVFKTFPSLENLVKPTMSLFIISSLAICLFSSFVFRFIFISFVILSTS